MNPSPLHPRPGLERDGWVSLDGAWEFALDRDALARRPGDVHFDATIRVPFAPETPASGVAATGFFQACWYRRRVALPPRARDTSALLHFGAVDWRASVFVDGQHACDHEGGYTPFCVDLADHVAPDATSCEIVVRAEDDPHDLAQPRGKQDWQEQPHAIWYPRTTGIWQTVWLEVVPATRIERVVFTPCLERFEIALDARVATAGRDDLRLHLRLHARDRLLADDTFSVDAQGLVARAIRIPDPGLDAERGLLLWHPLWPMVYDAELELCTSRGERLDLVRSHTALRSVAVENGRILLNGHPERLRLVLDQGYWPETGMTPPGDEALRLDVERVKALGFHGVRKHQKLEDPRFLGLADRHGLLVFEELPSAYRFSEASMHALVREWTRAIERDRNHPCIVAWVPLNESWGVPALASDESQRRFQRALYELTKALDPTRPVIANDGWEVGATDLLGVHDYEQDPERLSEAWLGFDSLPATVLARMRPSGRPVFLPGHGYDGQPVLLSECGGIAFAGGAKGSWGYAMAATAPDLEACVTKLLTAIHAIPGLAGFCWTQLTDTYQEANGLLFPDRTPKLPLDRLRRAITGRAL